MRLTRLAFRLRFTQAEKIAIEMAALDNPAAPLQQRMMAAALRADLADTAVSLYIDTERTETRAGCWPTRRGQWPGATATLLRGRRPAWPGASCRPSARKRA